MTLSSPPAGGSDPPPLLPPVFSPVSEPHLPCHDQPRILQILKHDGFSFVVRQHSVEVISLKYFTSFILTVSNSLIGSKLFEYLKLPVPLEAERL